MGEKTVLNIKRYYNLKAARGAAHVCKSTGVSETLTCERICWMINWERINYPSMMSSWFTQQRLISFDGTQDRTGCTLRDWKVCAHMTFLKWLGKLW